MTRDVVVFVGAWTTVSLVLAAFFYWLRPHVPTRRMVVVVRSGSRRRIVAVTGRRQAPARDRVVAEIDPGSRLITMPPRRVATADPGSSITVSGRLRYDIVDADKAAAAGEPIAVALGDGIIAAIDERLRDMPVGRAVRGREEVRQWLLEALMSVRPYGIAVTEVELTTFTGTPGPQLQP